MVMCLTTYLRSERDADQSVGGVHCAQFARLAAQEGRREEQNGMLATSRVLTSVVTGME